jgi:hypothetical protein
MPPAGTVTEGGTAKACGSDEVNTIAAPPVSAGVVKVTYENDRYSPPNDGFFDTVIDATPGAADASVKVRVADQADRAGAVVDASPYIPRTRSRCPDVRVWGRRAP